LKRLKRIRRTGERLKPKQDRDRSMRAYQLNPRALGLDPRTAKSSQTEASDDA